MRRRLSWLAASLALASNAGAATVLSRTIDIVIDPAGKVVENHSLRVRIETPSDREEWAMYPIAADENRKIEVLVASVEKPDGTVVKLDKKALDTIGLSGGGVLHDSRRYKTVAFPESPDGSVLLLTYKVEIKPYFPSSQIALLTSSPTESLQIRISGGGSSFRYRMDGRASGATINQVQGGVSVTATNLPKHPDLQYAPEEETRGPVLRYGWGGPSRWEDVGDWYLSLLRDVPRGSAAVQQDALALKAGDDRTTILKLLEFARTRVRYVAVEVGIGGYRPHPPEEVRAKGWGDCKDKATLLVEMLQGVGIEAFPALILASEEGRVDSGFPSADQFNHMIVAVPTTHLGSTDGLPVAAGYLFVDPTQEKGGLGWFHSSTQEQDALVVKPGASRLVRTPRMMGGDVRFTEIKMNPRPAGGFVGLARLNYKGDLASYFIEQSATRRAEDFRGDAESIVRARLPGSEVKFSGWTRGEGEVPEITFTADLALSLPASSRSLVLPATPFTPPLAILENRDADVILDVPEATTRWTVNLPSGWCPPTASPLRVENEIGLFRQTIESSGSATTVERHIEIRKRWVSKDLFPKLREIVLAEHRALARSLRFECAPAGGS